MDCNKFQDSITDYLDGALDSRAKAECAAHRLTCRECRELYNDVRSAVYALNAVGPGAIDEPEGPEGLENRIIAATTAGEMLSCSDFDRIIERYFDGVVLAPTFQTFLVHFEKCSKCRRLMAGIEDAIAMCRDLKETEVEVPDSLHDRIVAATLGAREADAGWFNRARSCFSGLMVALMAPQIAVAVLIFAASSLLVLSRFGSVSGMASHAGTQAEMLVNQGHKAINQTGAAAGAAAKIGFERMSYVNTLFFDGAITRPAQIRQIQKQSPPRPSPQPTTTPSSAQKRK